MKISLPSCLAVLLWAAVAFHAPPARATTVIPPSFDDLVSKADCVFTGDVTALRPEWTGEGEKRHIVTFVTFNILRVLKGEAASPFVLRTFGGTVGGETMAVADAPVFRVGERQIIFVRGNGRQFIPLVGIMHGQFRVDAADRVADHLSRPLTRVEDIGAADVSEDAVRRNVGGATGGAVKPAALNRAEFEDKIIAKVEANRVATH